jgi:hypothetical protein
MSRDRHPCYERANNDKEGAMNSELDDASDDVTNAKRMLVLFGVFTVIFVCGGGIVTGFFGYDSESAGVNAAMAATGPGCCSLAGLLAAAFSLLALKGKPTAQIVAPIIAGLAGGLVGGLGIFLFFEAIWPSL